VLGHVVDDGHHYVLRVGAGWNRERGTFKQIFGDEWKDEWETFLQSFADACLEAVVGHGKDAFYVGESGEDYLHGIEIVDDVLLSKFLIVTDDFHQSSVIVEASDQFLVKLAGQSIDCLFLLLQQALHAPNQQQSHVLRGRPHHRYLFCCQSAPHSLLEPIDVKHQSRGEDQPHHLANVRQHPFQQIVQQNLLANLNQSFGLADEDDYWGAMFLDGRV
jgi:hypothetical protein